MAKGVGRVKRQPLPDKMRAFLAMAKGVGRVRRQPSPGKNTSAVAKGMLLQMTKVQRSERFIDVENFADNVIHAE